MWMGDEGRGLGIVCDAWGGGYDMLDVPEGEHCDAAATTAATAGTNTKLAL